MYKSAFLPVNTVEISANRVDPLHAGVIGVERPDKITTQTVAVLRVVLKGPAIATVISVQPVRRALSTTGIS